jgi:ADP-heptose:LPS heptosyltransferase
MKKLTFVKLGALGDSIDTLWYLASLCANFNTTIIVLDKYAAIYKLMNCNFRLVEIKSYKNKIFTSISAIYTILKNYNISTNFIALMQYNIKYYLFFKIFYPISKIVYLKNDKKLSSSSKNRVDNEIQLIYFLTGKLIEKIKPVFLENTYALPEINTPYIVYAIGGGNTFDDAKNRLGSIEQVGNALYDMNNYSIVLLGFGKSDEIRAEAFISKYKNYYQKNIINMVGKVKIEVTIELIKNAVLFIGYDSSLLKIANIMRKKGVVLLGPTTANQLLDESTSITAIITDQFIKCMPCYKSCDGIKSPMFTCNDNICIKSIKSSTINFYLKKTLIKI